jgi:hypothetical protein
MTERKPDTGSDWHDPDDAPELTEEMLDHAEFSIGGKVIRPATGILTADGIRPIAAPGDRSGGRKGRRS